MRALRCLVVFAILSVTAVASMAAEPAHTTFAPKPPGTIVQNQRVYLSGQAMTSQWRAVTSKVLKGSSFGTKFYQWYLSIYAIRGSTYSLKYQSPANGGPLDVVAKAHGAPLWFPLQEERIVGVGQFMQPGVEQLVVASHQSGADCGAAEITIFTFDIHTQKIVPAVSLRNGCALRATVIDSSAAHGPSSLALTGPYYAPTAAMCCPTKVKAAATLRFRGGVWIETPKYFPLVPNRFSKP